MKKVTILAVSFLASLSLLSFASATPVEYVEVLPAYEEVVVVDQPVYVAPVFLGFTLPTFSFPTIVLPDFGSLFSFVSVPIVEFYDYVCDIPEFTFVDYEPTVPAFSEMTVPEYSYSSNDYNIGSGIQSDYTISPIQIDDNYNINSSIESDY
jgi:hypothetical protein